nr:hypothetical protein [Angustibacter aerolatus]
MTKPLLKLAKFLFWIVLLCTFALINQVQHWGLPDFGIHRLWSAAETIPCTYGNPGSRLHWLARVDHGGCDRSRECVRCAAGSGAVGRPGRATGHGRPARLRRLRPGHRPVPPVLQAAVERGDRRRDARRVGCRLSVREDAARHLPR